MSKKLLTILILTFAVFSMAVSSFAMSTGEVYGETPSLAEQYAELSDEQKEIFSAKLNRDRTTLADIPATASANATWRYVAYFEGFTQETKYWCVPASCQAAVNCLTGVKPSQSSIASALGMVDGHGIAFAYARSYLNSAQSNNLYIHMASTTAEDVMQAIFMTLCSLMLLF